MNNIQKEEEHSLQWSVHFDIDRSLRQTGRKTPCAPAIHDGYYPERDYSPKQQLETKLWDLTVNDKHHYTVLYYFLII